MLIHNTTQHIYEDRNCRYAPISRRRIRFTILICVSRNGTVQFNTTAVLWLWNGPRALQVCRRADNSDQSWSQSPDERLLNDSIIPLHPSPRLSPASPLWWFCRHHPGRTCWRPSWVSARSCRGMWWTGRRWTLGNRWSRLRSCQRFWRRAVRILMHRHTGRTAKCGRDVFNNSTRGGRRRRRRRRRGGLWKTLRWWH